MSLSDQEHLNMRMRMDAVTRYEWLAAFVEWEKKVEVKLAGKEKGN